VTNRRRNHQIAILLGTFFTYAAVFGPIYSRTGEVVTALTLVPVTIAAWITGWPGALLTALLYIPVNIVLLNLAGASGLQLVSNLWPGVFGSAAVGLMVGVLSDALKKLKARTRELTTQGERLQSEIQQRERVQIELAGANEKLEYEMAELKRVSEALQENQRMLSTLLGNLPGMAYRRGNDRHWTIGFVSGGCLALTGYEPHHLIDNAHLSYNDLIHFEDREPVWLAVQAALTGQKPFQLVYRILAADGTLKWVWEQGQGVFDENERLVALEGFIADISQRKQAEDKLVRLDKAIEQAAEAIFVTDADWIIQYVNPAFERLTGYAAGEIIGLHTRTLRSHKHSSAFYENMRDTLAQGQVWSGRIVNRKKDGSFYDAEATASPVKNKSGVTINYVNIQRDISKEIRLEKELLQARKLEAIGTLAGGIAHDFNNLLVPILGYAEMALSDTTHTSQTRYGLEQTLHAALRARDLVKQILTFGRSGTEQQKIPVEIGSIVKEALKLLRASLPTSIEIRQNIGNGAASADPTQIHQVLMNLCTNASHAMAGKGILDVSLSRVNLSKSDLAEQSIVDLEPGPHLKLCVSDTGSGMDKAVLERIFDPYFTTREMGQGSGLGLAVVHGIVKWHGGAITVRSEPGKGSAFSIYIPSVEKGTGAAVESRQKLPAGTERILLIDDEQIVVETGTAILKQLGYKVTPETDGLRALEIFRSTPGNFDLVITDYTMPNMTGTDLSKDLRQIRPDIPIILCTGFSEKVTPTVAADHGLELVMKPFSMKQIAELVRKALQAQEPGVGVDSDHT
jgi:PAS domain S-box-containing protein